MITIWHTRFSFFKTARDLENDRLRAQIDDCATVLDMVLDDGGSKEPAFHMWKDSLDALLVAGMIFSFEWTFHRGYEDRTFWKFSRLADERSAVGDFVYEHPPWFRDADVCRSHRSVLMSREPEVYDAELWPGTPSGLPLLWPVPAKDPGLYDLKVAKADLPLVVSGSYSIPDAIRTRITNLKGSK